MTSTQTNAQLLMRNCVALSLSQVPQKEKAEVCAVRLPGWCCTKVRWGGLASAGGSGEGGTPPCQKQTGLVLGTEHGKNPPPPHRQKC